MPNKTERQSPAAFKCGANFKQNNTMNLEILMKAFNRMDAHFTSDKFIKVARSLGYCSKEIDKRRHLDFLHAYAVRVSGYDRRWTKEMGQIPTEKQVPQQQPKTSIEEAIQLLKSNGYRILKPVNEFIEL